MGSDEEFNFNTAVLLAKSPKDNGGVNVGETLKDHSLKTLEYGIFLIDQLPFTENERKFLKESAFVPLLFHDIGKAAKGFQDALLQSAHWKGKRHEILSSAFCYQLGLSEEQLFSIITHHKDIDKLQSLRSQKDVSCGEFKTMKKEFEINLNQAIDVYLSCLENPDQSLTFFDIDDLKEKLDNLKNKELHSNWGIQKSWINGNLGLYSQVTLPLEKRIFASKLRGIVKAADHLSSAGIAPRKTISLKDYTISEYELRQFQKTCSECNNNLILTAPTGSGKTEAALLWAQNNFKENSRLFYVLPYQASINSMYMRLKSIFNTGENDENPVGILHGNSVSYLYHIQNDDKDESKNKTNNFESVNISENVNKSTLEMQKEAEIQAGLTKEIYYQIRACTPHQILRLGLRGKGWEFLFLEFHNSLVIYDEIHAYEPRLVGLTLATARLLQDLGCKICFMSATFPIFLKPLIREKISNAIFDEISPNSIFESDKKIWNQKRHLVHVLEGNLTDYLDSIYNISTEASGKKSILVIANHVKSAQKIFDSLTEMGLDCLLLHGRFNKKDRNQKEKKILKKEDKPQIVVATQVIEVSLDIDYDVMFTEPAPIDALSQRFGRVNRKGEREPADIFVVRQQLSSHNLYTAEKIAKTLDLLSEIKEPIGEQDLLEIVDTVYESGYNEAEYQEFEAGFNAYIFELEENLIAGSSNNWLENLDKGFGHDILPLQDVDEFIRLKEEGHWIKANDLLITRKLYNKDGWMNGSLDLDKKYEKYFYDIVVLNRGYDPEKGLSDEIYEKKKANIF
jgi:CRISPR-associated helicase Cas3/CRISPR-associated endonuclease Cas3-HD